MDLLKLLKMDLMINTDRQDALLSHIINAAMDFIEREGITLTDSDEDSRITLMYAAWLYRRRKEDGGPMPRSLRWALNNRLLSEKMR